MVEAVVFDVGGVLIPEGTRMERLQNFVVELAGSIDREAFREAYWASRDTYDLGAADADFWTPVLAAAGVGEQADHRLIDKVARQDANLNSTITEEPRQLLDELGAAGVRLAILSNAPRRMAEAVRDREWYAPFHTAVFSSEHGVMKPDAGAYELVDEHLSLTAEDRAGVVFFDDRETNIQGAEAHGWAGHLWRGVADARMALAAAGLNTTNKESGL